MSSSIEGPVAGSQRRRGCVVSATEGWKGAVKEEGTKLTTSITAPTVEAALKEIPEAAAAGADIIELRLDLYADFKPQEHLATLIQACQDQAKVPCIVTYRPVWEGGKYDGGEAQRLGALRYAAVLGARYVDVEFKAATVFFAAPGMVPETTAIIVSSHNYEATPGAAELVELANAMWDAGADIVKIATTATDVADCRNLFALLAARRGPTVALAMGERGVMTRILSGKYGGYLTFGAMGAGRESAPGQPTIGELRNMYRLASMGPKTKVYGVIGNPVAQSKSPAIHNAAFAQLGTDAVYVPLLVDDMERFLEAYDDPDFAGFSVTIPHKGAALAGADHVDPVAQEIGAVNTLVRSADSGELTGYNTDWEAAIGAIEEALRGKDGSGAPKPLTGKTVVVIGAGGAGRGLVFGALERGAAEVVVCNRSIERAEQLAAEVGERCRAATLADLAGGQVTGDVLANTTSVGMVPEVDASPVPAEVAGSFAVVFDAVYNPLETKLLREAVAGGAAPASGVDMFVGQAARQFELFTGVKEAPRQLMKDVVLGSLDPAKR
ncbi:unnamed protein product [Pedinophyceae sp. YPF-701]|nr:unnamed protein product [Pedinophyceae sp. YPF-701]